MNIEWLRGWVFDTWLEDVFFPGSRKQRRDDDEKFFMFMKAFSGALKERTKELKKIRDEYETR